MDVGLLRNLMVCLVFIAGSWPERASAGGTVPQAAADFHRQIQPLLARYCYDCHGEGEHKGNVSLDAFASDEALLGNRELWWKVLKNVRAGIMPPAKEAQPSKQEKQQLSDWIKYGSFAIDPADPDPGRVTMRRLNRVEYRNTIRELMGIDFDTAEEFPADDTGYGFDTIGDALSVSPLLLEKYMQAAQTIVAAAVPMVAKQPAEQLIWGHDFRTADRRQNGTDLDFYARAAVSAQVTVAQTGDYLLKGELAVHGDFDFDPGGCTFTCRVADEQAWREEFRWAWGKATEFEVPQHWDAGEHTITFELEPLLTPDHRKTSIHMHIEKVRVVGPMQKQRWVAPENYHRFFPRDEAPAAEPSRAAYAREVLRAFAKAAFRRPVDDQTLGRLVSVAELNYTEPGKTFEQGIGQAMVASLASPRFLFRTEQSAPRHRDEAFSPVDEYALASRLSYFLWSTMPDDRLFSLAEQGQLRANLDAEVKRMLSDPRADALVSNFCGQWLELRDLDGVPISPREILRQERPPMTPEQIAAAKKKHMKFDFGPGVRRALRQEPERVFSRILREDRSLGEMIDSDYTFLNGKLAKLYGIPNITGDDMQLVTLPAGSPRGGLLTMGSFLVVTSNPTRTSPVKRGQFILNNVLGMPAPPPPPNIPPLEAARTHFQDREPTFREVLEIHRGKPMCASCHSRMDPLGLALEHFNAMGMWREMEHGLPIDSSGKLLTGETFSDVRELKKIISGKHAADFYRCLTEKLLTYALGRGLDYYDVESVDRIVDRLERDNGRASTLLSGIIHSIPFQERRNRSTDVAAVPEREQRAELQKERP